MKRYMPDYDPALGYAFMEEHPAGSYIAYSDYVKAMDAYHGTPCEEIRHQQAIAALQAKLDAVTKDAGRYRWLRHKITCGHLSIEEEVGIIGAKSPCDLDAAIDRALTDQGRAGEGR